jgi:hypothetical protein
MRKLSCLSLLVGCLLLLPSAANARTQTQRTLAQSSQAMPSQTSAPRHPSHVTSINGHQQQSMSDFRNQQRSQSSSGSGVRIRGRAIKGIFVIGFLLISGLIGGVRMLFRGRR